MATSFIERCCGQLQAGLRELRAQVQLKVWTWSYSLEERREAAAHKQRNLRCAGYCLLLALCGALGRR